MNPFLKSLPKSASMEVVRLANELKAAGHKVFPMGAGDTHFAPPAAVAKAIEQSVDNGHTHYLAASGIPALRESISKHDYPAYNASEILVAPGVKQAMYYYMLARNYKRVCVLEPAWLGYKAIAVMTNTEYVAINFKEAGWEDKLQNESFDLLLFGSPNNPDGKVFSQAELDAIDAAVAKNGAEVAIDEIYRVYDFEQQNDTSRYYGRDNAVIFNGFSKSHAMTGLRIGYMCTKDADLWTACLKMQQNIATCANSVAQFAAVEAPKADAEVAMFSEYYKANRDLIAQIIPEFEPFKPAGAFYYFVDLAQFGIDNTRQWCANLLQEKHVASVPGGAFGDEFESWVRFSFCLDQTLLEEAAHIVKKHLGL